MKNLKIYVFCPLLAFQLLTHNCVNGQNSEKSSPVSGVVLIPWFETRLGLIMPREESEISAWIHNTSKDPLHKLTASIELSGGLRIESGSAVQTLDLRPLESKRLVWQVTATQAGSFRLKLNVKSDAESTNATQWLNVVTHRDPRHELQITSGSWAPYPDHPTLQDQNKNKVENLVTLPSDKLKSNKFGITAHLPRSIDDEDLFNALHLVDGDPETSWHQDDGVSRFLSCPKPLKLT